MKNAASAFDDFKEKFSRFNASGNDLPPLKKNSSKSSSAKIKEKISSSDEEHVQKIINKYNQYQLPLSKEIEEDELSVLKAYELFSRIRELNSSLGTKKTFIEKIRIASPVAEKQEYVSGTGFAYLQAWFILNHREKAKSFIPVISEHRGDAELAFASAECFKPSPLLKEILTLIQK